MPGENTDYKKLLTDVIQKQIIILGPTITLAKARNVKGITVSDDGTVTAMQGQPQDMIQQLIDQFVQLSGLIVRKTMEPLLSAYPDGASTATVISASSQAPIPSPQIITNQQQSSLNNTSSK